MEFNQVQSKKGSNSWKVFKYFLGFLFIVAITGVNAGFLYLNYQNQTNAANQAPKTNEEIAGEVVASFGTVYKIPEGENPTVIVITDVEKLKETQADFYKDAQNGDHVIVIFSSKLAFIYRVDAKQIINVSQVSTDDAAAAQ